MTITSTTNAPPLSSPRRRRAHHLNRSPSPPPAVARSRNTPKPCRAPTLDTRMLGERRDAGVLKCTDTRQRLPHAGCDRPRARRGHP